MSDLEIDSPRADTRSDAPLPDAPLPDAPLPDAPLPDTAAPDAPTPDVGPIVPTGCSVTAGAKQSDVATSIAVDTLGNVYVTGHFTGVVPLGSKTLTSKGMADAFVAKFDKSCTLLWVVTFGGIEDDTGFSIVLGNAGDIYVTGSFMASVALGTTTLTSKGSRDIFVAKLDKTGTFLWANSAGNTGFWNRSTSIGVDASGSCYVTGWFEASAAFGTTTFTTKYLREAFVAKWDSLGKLQWVKTAGGSWTVSGYSIAVDNAGNSHVAGSFGNHPTSGKYGTAAFGSTTLTTTDFEDAFIAKLDTNGNFKWAVSGGGKLSDAAKSIALDGAGNSYATGHAQVDAWSGPATFGTTILTSGGAFVTKVDGMGQYQWTVAPKGITLGDVITADGSGNSYVAGTFAGKSVFGATALAAKSTHDVFVAKLDNTGSFKWAIAAGTGKTVSPWSIGVDGAGHSYLAGYYYGSHTFGGHAFSWAGDNDLFMVKVDKKGLF